MATLVIPSTATDQTLFNDTTFGVFTVLAGCQRIAPGGILKSSNNTVSFAASSTVSFRKNDNSLFVPGTIGLHASCSSLTVAGYSAGGSMIAYGTVTGTGNIEIADKTPVARVAVSTNAGSWPAITGFTTQEPDSIIPLCLSINLPVTSLV